MTGREIDSAVADAAEAENVRGAFLVYLDFAGGPVRVCSLPYPITIDADGDSIAETYIGIGNLGSISPIQETNELRANGVKLTLSGLASELLSIALAEHYQGRAGKIWVALFDEDHQPILDPFQVFSGRMDTMTINRGKESSIEVAVESALVDLERERLLRFTDEDQQHLWPGDKGLEYTAISASREVIWGSTKPDGWGNGTNNGGA